MKCPVVLNIMGWLLSQRNLLFNIAQKSYLIKCFVLFQHLEQYIILELKQVSLFLLQAQNFARPSNSYYKL
jgi:hypothetical protein